jgi:hypothetical protein
MRLKRCGSIEMESELPSDQHFEDELVKGEKSYNPWALKCHRENLRKIGIHLSKVRCAALLVFRGNSGPYSFDTDQGPA